MCIRDSIGVVLQDTYLFTDTIKDNINITNRLIKNEEIIEACKLADIYEDIKGFDKNIDYIKMCIRDRYYISIKSKILGFIFSTKCGKI